MGRSWRLNKLCCEIRVGSEKIEMGVGSSTSVMTKVSVPVPKASYVDLFGTKIIAALVIVTLLTGGTDFAVGGIAVSGGTVALSGSSVIEAILAFLSYLLADAGLAKVKTDYMD